MDTIFNNTRNNTDGLFFIRTLHFYSKKAEILLILI
jgi:hypothetical protein